MTLKRDLIKYVRDRAKSRYKKGTQCEICGVSENLDFHHYYSLTGLLNKWQKANSLNIITQQQILQARDRFIQQHQKQLYQDTVTLCNPHHRQLHGIYGKQPSLATAQKQRRWVLKQRQKHEV